MFRVRDPESLALPAGFVMETVATARGGAALISFALAGMETPAAEETVVKTTP